MLFSHAVAVLRCAVLTTASHFAYTYHYLAMQWDFEKHLFEPATLFICEGTHTFSLTIIANVGYRKENLKVSLQKDMLVIHGQRDAHYEPVDDAGHCPSRRRIPLSFTRYVPIPSYCDPSSVSAGTLSPCSAVWYCSCSLYAELQCRYACAVCCAHTPDKESAWC